MWCPCFPKTIWKGLTSEQFPTLLQSILNELWSREEGRVCASCSLASSLQTHTYTKICVHITMISVLVKVWNCHTHSLYAVTESNTKYVLHYSFSVFTPIHTIFRAIELQLPSYFGDAEMKFCCRGLVWLASYILALPSRDERAEQAL